jgi:hypothetical protein
MGLAKLAKPLGWFSLALGAAELLKGRDIARLHGVPEGKNVVRGFGAREIAAGAAVLARPTKAWPFLLRAGGDLLDVGAAGYAANKASGDKGRVAKASLATVAGFLVLDLLVARSLAKR